MRRQQRREVQVVSPAVCLPGHPRAADWGARGKARTRLRCGHSSSARLQTRAEAVRVFLLVLGGVLLLVGCGHAPDPFVGTWKLGGGPGSLVVSHVAGSRYRLTQMHGANATDVVTMILRGATLRGSLSQFNDTWQTLTLTFARLSDGRMRLTVSEPSANITDGTFILSKVSDSSRAPTPSTEPTPFQGVATKVFASAALGVSFRYPTSWRVKMDSLSAGGRVSLSPPGQTASGARFVVSVVFRRPSAAAAPFPFSDGSRSQLARSSAALSAAGSTLSGAELDAIGGLRLTHVDYSRESGIIRWFGFAVASEKARASASSLIIEAAAPESLWISQNSLFYSILFTMRFTRPQG
jgi:hypothetical protein